MLLAASCESIPIAFTASSIIAVFVAFNVWHAKPVNIFFSIQFYDAKYSTVSYFCDYL